MKRIILAACAAACAVTVAGPKRHPSYEPDGKPISGEAAKVANLFLNAKATATGQFDKFAPKLAVDGKRDDGTVYWGA